MGFRRTKRQALESAAWQEFVSANRDLACEIGIAEDVLAVRRHFDYFLMHGYHPASASRLPAHAELTDGMRSLVRRLVGNYFEAGFDDPGVAVLSPDDVQELRT